MNLYGTIGATIASQPSACDAPAQFAGFEFNEFIWSTPCVGPGETVVVDFAPNFSPSFSYQFAPSAPVVSVVNNTGAPANQLHIDMASMYAQLVGGLVVANAPGCPQPVVSVEPDLLNVTWPDNCVDPGEKVAVHIAAALSPPITSRPYSWSALVPTPTPTPTATPNPVPRMQKVPALQNLFLTRQGAKIPPVRCVDGTDAATLTESISVPITGPDPKDPTQPQQLGGFSFQVKYDPLKVCVRLRPGPPWTVNPQQVCTIEDSVTKPTLQGVARINCVTLGKATVVNTTTAAGRMLALIEVRPQPGLYSTIKPNQDNGQAVQLLNEGCKLTDLQGHAIEVFSCEDADVTIRFLEGDVEPDCQVNALDTQAIAFRWGAHKGQTQLYNERFNLEPSGTLKDQDIDVSDLQFVFGRFGSSCTSPWPAQLPVNPKA